MKIGDRVRFINQNGEGIVKDVSANFVIVINDDGFDCQVKKRDVVLIRQDNNLEDQIKLLNRGFCHNKMDKKADI